LKDSKKTRPVSDRAIGNGPFECEDDVRGKEKTGLQVRHDGAFNRVSR